MCGIYGNIGTKFNKINDVFSDNLNNRGPDDRDFFIDRKNNILLGHLRLSIIDTSTRSKQPMVSNKNDFVITFNGEIYNYVEIKKELLSLGYVFKTSSDTEVLLNAYIQWKEKSLEKLRGMFSFCVYDKKNKSFFLARDRFGIKPLLYYQDNNNFIFSSELKPFLNSRIIDNEVDSEAISQYYRYGSIKQPKTILKNVKSLLPGHYMIVSKDLKVQQKKYYDFQSESLKIQKINDYHNAVNLVKNELESATKYHMVSDVEVGAFLSGGIDSSAVVGLMKKFSNDKIRTFSIGFKNNHEVEDETDIAKRTSKFLNTKHHSILIDGNYVKNIFEKFIKSIDQPSIDGLNTFIVSMETSKHMKVALSGLGGDELFAGYRHFNDIKTYSQKNKNSLHSFVSSINKLRPNRFLDKYQHYGLNEEYILDSKRQINKRLNHILKNHHHIIRQTNESLSSLSSLQKISLLEINDYLLNTLLRDCDVLSMANSLEVRPVLLDHKIAELAFRLEDSFKIRDGKFKSVFVDAVKDIIPSEVWKRPKSGFELPFASWMNNELNDYFLEFVNSKVASQILNDKHLLRLRNRAKYKTLRRNDWLDFIFLAWLNINKIKI